MSARRWGLVAVIAMGACKPAEQAPSGAGKADTTAAPAERIADRVARYSTVRLTADLAPLSARERQMIPLLIDAAREMDTIYWHEAYGSRDSLLASLTDPSLRRFAEINYGPWDRLEDNRLFVPEVGAKPAGAGFYPTDLTAPDFQTAAAADTALKSPYTIVRRDSAGKLKAIPYHVAFAQPTARAAAKLREAAKLADDPGLRTYLDARAKALETDNYRASDISWLDMKKNRLDIVIGPIETYEDGLVGIKTAHEAYVLIKDLDWSRRLARYAAMLPGLQRGLPVPGEFKRETPGTDSDLNAYDVVYYAGQANAGGKTIAINLPNDEQVQLKKGTRRLQLKNAMRAKFDRIMVPIADALITPDQQKHITFDAFFENTMFHEVAHGLGIKQTINGKGTVRQALKERNGGLEEEKADVLGLYMVAALNAQGELKEDLLDNYVTFLAGIIRSVRFGAADAHGRANMATFSFLQERGAFARDSATGTYRVDQARMADAVNALAGKILQLQGTGDYAGVGTFMDTIIRSVRFGAADAHGRANMATFSFLQERGAFARDSATGTYRVDQARMADAVNALAGKILQLQGTGDYAGVGTFMDTSGKVGPTLQGDLDRLKSKGIPVDIIFEQGPDVLGLGEAPR